jgi:hypothetical protein
MDFIEQILGISPDGGSGATELMLMTVPVVVIVLLTLRRQIIRRAFSTITFRR